MPSPVVEQRRTLPPPPPHRRPTTSVNFCHLHHARRLPGTTPVLSLLVVLLPVASPTARHRAATGALHAMTTFSLRTVRRAGGPAMPLGRGLGHP
jgi:hypothetical protein